jgi:hypothetical protein
MHTDRQRALLHLWWLSLGGRDSSKELLRI